jgi:hypothetical protein
MPSYTLALCAMTPSQTAITIAAGMTAGTIKKTSTVRRAAWDRVSAKPYVLEPYYGLIVR